MTMAPRAIETGLRGLVGGAPNRRPQAGEAPLRVPQEYPSCDLLAMVRPYLRIRVRAGIHQAGLPGSPTLRRGCVAIGAHCSPDKIRRFTAASIWGALNQDYLGTALAPKSQYQPTSIDRLRPDRHRGLWSTTTQSIEVDVNHRRGEQGKGL